MSAPARRLLDDCFLHDKDRLKHDQALALLQERLVPIAGTEEVMLAEAHRRVVAEDVVSPRNVPAFDNAAVDGYALVHAALDPEAATDLPVVMRIAAGAPGVGALSPDACARIFPGAVMPEGADTVIMQEDVETREEAGATVVSIPPGARAGANMRKAGEDVAQGRPVAEAGSRLRPQELAAVASLGIDRVRCFERLKVALVSTGDEIVRPGAPLGPGGVYDSNHFLLSALLETVDAEVTDLGVLPDRTDVVNRVLSDAAESHHVILTTGGASRGEEDHIVDAVLRLGQLHAWQLAVKPGRPLAFATLRDAVFLGLPGNPVAAMVCFLLYAQPMFALLQGADWRPPLRFRVPAGFEVKKKKPDRREFLRGWIEHDEAGGPMLVHYPQDGSGLISSLRAADGLIEIEEPVTSVARGEALNFIPFTAFGLAPK
ncbi:MAG: molybdopterin molybdotransferase MoeA [Hyphomicrobiales bacterium]